MDWDKVAKALDDEWWSRSKLAERNHGDDAKMHRLIGTICFVLRDALVAGIPKKDA